MRQTVLACAVLLVWVTSGAQAQWLETTIGLPDSLSGLYPVNCLVHNPADNRVYAAGGGGWMIVLDAVTGAKLGRFAVPRDVEAMCVNPLSSRLYAATRDTIFAVDCATGSVTMRIAVYGYRPAIACYPEAGRVYAVDADSDDVLVIDCGPDTVLARIATGEPAQSFAVCPAHSKVYCGLRYADTSVVVIDARGDSLLGSIAMYGANVAELLYDPVSDRLFCPDYPWGALAVVDCARDSVVRYLSIGDAPWGMCLDTRDNKVYLGAEYNYLPVAYVFDGANGALLERVVLPGEASALAYDSVNNLVFCGTSDDSMGVIDCASDSLVAAIVPGGRTDAVWLNAAAGRLIAGYDGLFVIDAAARQVLSYVPLAMAPAQLCRAAAGDKLYCADAGRGLLAVLDAATNGMLGIIKLGGTIGDMAWCPVGNKLYVACCEPSRLEVLDCAADTLVAAIPLALPPSVLCYAPRRNLLYCAGQYGPFITVIECGRDSVVATVPVDNDAGAMVYDPVDDRVYAARVYSALVIAIDCSTNTVLATVPVGGDPTALCYVAEGNYVACAVPDIEAISAIDCAANRVTAIAPVYGGCDVMTWNPLWNKLYCGLSGTWLVSVVDCREWRQLGVVVTGDDPAALLCDTIADRLYCANYRAASVSVIRCRDDRLAATVRVGAFPVDIAWFPELRRVFVANSGSSSISVIRDTTVTGIAQAMNDERGTTALRATIVRGVLCVPSSPFTAHTSLFDFSGRRVMGLQPGPNDVSALPAGVYFIRERSAVSGQPSVANTKVVIQK